MTQHDTDPLRDLETETYQSGTQFARGLRTGHPHQPGECQRHRGVAWCLVALSVGMLITGMVLPQGLLLAVGLVTAGWATTLLTPP
ncbi:DUF3040 domain-containing protein [Streptomyces sp. NPDC005732]|uniref:DUF3040 domain-containing protein n=1 Tax=Streptomyces sp. NPDC005732 TaxID=3157057 RepID=UPI0033C88454